VKNWIQEMARLIHFNPIQEPDSKMPTTQGGQYPPTAERNQNGIRGFQKWGNGTNANGNSKRNRSEITEQRA
jgi:hypothetical protein